MLAGVPSVFVRLPGCPLRCNWCDSAYAWDFESGDLMEVFEIVNECASYNCSHLVITGGEPLVNLDLLVLLNELRSSFDHITVETAGIEYVANLPIDLVSLSPKLSNSLPANDEKRKKQLEFLADSEILTDFIDNYNTQLKFVVESEIELPEIRHLLSSLPPLKSSQIMFMPQAKDKDEYASKSRVVVDLCMKNGYSFSPRLHVQFWGNKRGV